jgi:hypothetical protein
MPMTNDGETGIACMTLEKFAHVDQHEKNDRRNRKFAQKRILSTIAYRTATLVAELTMERVACMMEFSLLNDEMIWKEGARWSWVVGLQRWLEK